MPEIFLVLGTIIFPIALFNMFWSAGGAWGFIRGDHLPIQTYRLHIFLGSLFVMLYELIYFFELDARGEGVLSLGVLMLVFMHQAIAAFTRWTTLRTKADAFFWLYESDHLEVALSIAKLNAVDHDAAEELACKARKKYLEVKTSND